MVMTLSPFYDPEPPIDIWCFFKLWRLHSDDNPIMQKRFSGIIQTNNTHYSGWWFGTFFYFPSIHWGFYHPN